MNTRETKRRSQKASPEPATPRQAQLLAEVQKEEGLEIQLHEALRQTNIKAHREKIIKALRPTNAFLERSLERMFAHGNGSLRQKPSDGSMPG